MEICLGKTVDDNLLQVMRTEVQRLSDSLDDFKHKGDKDIQSICSTLALFKSELNGAIQVLKNQHRRLQSTCMKLRKNQDMIKEEISSKDRDQREMLRISELHWETRQQQVNGICKTLEARSQVMKKDLEMLKIKMDNLSFSESPIDVIFEAPNQNEWFTGREEIIEKLERYLPFKSEGLRMAALCGLGGCGKTTLGAQFAWKHKADYEGGVFWISMENDKKLENSMNDLALRLGIWADSFDLTLSKVLTWISKQTKPWLLVLDDVDQLHLSEQMHKVLSGRWKRQAKGHVLLTTRRESKVVNQSIDLEATQCVDILAFSEQEAKRFLVTRCGSTVAENESDLNELVCELGYLPLALEQAGAHIKALQCPISIYLKEYKVQRLKLLNQQPRTKPSWEYESNNRLAVHTTWILNFDYVTKSSHGDIASHFVETAAFLEPNEIHEELINCQLLSTDESSRSSSNFSLLMKCQIVDILTKFSLFQRKSSNTLGIHRLVQEVIRSRMTIKETASSLLRAVNLLHQAFRDNPSPDQIPLDIVAGVKEQPSTAVPNPSLLFLWSKLTCHASELQNHLKDFLNQDDVGREDKNIVLTYETSRIIYENAMQLSAHCHDEEAKETEHFSFQILNACTTDSNVTLTLDQLKKLFPHALPLPPLLKKIILYSSRPPPDNKNVLENEDHLVAEIEELRLKGNMLYKDAHFKEAIESYTDALEVSKMAKHLDPRLLNNRATAYLKLGNHKECLADSQEYIKLRPNCWKGYTRKALALNGLGRRGFALCFAAMAYYHDASSCRRYEAFQNTFEHLDGNWEVVESSESLKECIIRSHDHFLTSRKTVLLLTSKSYEVQHAQIVEDEKQEGVTNVLINADGSNAIVGTTLAACCEGSEVTINCGGLCFSRKCFVHNVTFLTQRTIFVEEDGNVEFTNCKFKSTCTLDPAVVVYGLAKFINCSITDSPGGGITVEYSTALASLINCKVNRNGKGGETSSGIKVIDQGSLEVNECQVHGNTKGIIVTGTKYNNSIAKRVLIQNSEIFDNKFEGVSVEGHHSFSFEAVVIRRNKIYHNGAYGIRVQFYVNNIVFEENTVFENFWWGVWVECNSGGYYKGNEICNNKMGGIRVGRQSPGRPPCVAEGNVIHHNYGPAFHEGLKFFEVISFPKELGVYFVMHEETKSDAVLRGDKDAFEVSLPNAVSALYKSNNQCYQNNMTQINLHSASLKTNCAFCFRHDPKLLSCKGCMTARYCGKECQRSHWSSHKNLCKATRQINTIEIRIPLDDPEKAPPFFYITQTHPSLEPTGPLYASPPPRDGSRFVVKMQTSEGLAFGKLLHPQGYVSDDYNPYKAQITIYDRSRFLDFKIRNQPELYHLIMGCGMMGAFMYLGKKLFCWAAFKDPKTIEIFTHEFPPVQKW